MLNYIALWLGVYLFSLGGPLQNDRDASLPVSNDIVESAHLPVFWGDPVLQGLHIGLFIALVAVVHLLADPEPLDHRLRGARGRPQPRGRALRRDERRQELRAGDGGLRRVRRARGVARRARAGSSGSRPTTSRSRRSASSASPWRCSAATRRSARSPRRCCSAALLSGTSQRNLDPTIFEPELASNLTTIIQGLVVLFVSADVLVLGMLRRGRGLLSGRRRSQPPAEAEAEA